MVHHNSMSSLVVEVKSKKHFDPLLSALKELVPSKFNKSFSWGNAVLRYQDRLCVPDVDDLRRHIMENAYDSQYPLIRVPPKCIMTFKRCIGETV